LSDNRKEYPMKATMQTELIARCIALAHVPEAVFEAELDAWRARVTSGADLDGEYRRLQNRLVRLGTEASQSAT
jgi:hypothetical protein